MFRGEQVHVCSGRSQLYSKRFRRQLTIRGLTLRDTPTPHTLDVKLPPSPSRFAFFAARSPLHPNFNAKRLFTSSSGCRIAAISESGEKSQFSRYQDTRTTNHQRRSYETKDYLIVFARFRL